VGTGSGCVGITLALELPQARVSAVDISPEALAIARENAQELGAHISFHRSDIYSGLSPDLKGGFDSIVANTAVHSPPHFAHARIGFELRTAAGVGRRTGRSALIEQLVNEAPFYLRSEGLSSSRSDLIRRKSDRFSSRPIFQHRNRQDFNGHDRIVQSVQWINLILSAEKNLSAPL